MEHLQHGGVRLAFARSGAAGDPVVLVHGSWDDHRTWARVGPGLAGSLQVLVFDRRGHGETTGPERKRPVRDDADDLAELLSASGQFPSHIVAHGYAGAIALRLAVDRPELVRSIAVHEPPFVGLLNHPPASLAATSGGPSPRAALQRLRDLAVAGDREGAASGYLEAFAAEDERWDALGPGARACMVELAPVWALEAGDPEALGPMRKEIGTIDVPVLITAGRRSPPFAATIAERLVEALPNATAVRLPGTGHFVQRTDPDLYVGVLGSFLLERNVPST